MASAKIIYLWDKLVETCDATLYNVAGFGGNTAKTLEAMGGRVITNKAGEVVANAQKVAAGGEGLGSIINSNAAGTVVERSGNTIIVHEAGSMAAKKSLFGLIASHPFLAYVGWTLGFKLSQLNRDVPEFNELPADFYADKLHYVDNNGQEFVPSVTEIDSTGKSSLFANLKLLAKYAIYAANHGLLTKKRESKTPTASAQNINIYDTILTTDPKDLIYYICTQVAPGYASLAVNYADEIATLIATNAPTANLFGLYVGGAFGVPQRLELFVTCYIAGMDALANGTYNQYTDPVTGAVYYAMELADPSGLQYVGHVAQSNPNAKNFVYTGETDPMNPPSFAWRTTATPLNRGMFPTFAPMHIHTDAYSSVPDCHSYEASSMWLSEGRYIDGIEEEPGATRPDFSDLDYSNEEDVLTAADMLAEEYPQYIREYEWTDENGILHTVRYIATGLPHDLTNGLISGDGLVSTVPQYDPALMTDAELATLLNLNTANAANPGEMEDTAPQTNTDPADPYCGAGAGVPPLFNIPTGSAKAMYTMYNPTQAQLDALGAVLWSSNFITQFVNFVTDPVNAIISLHKIYATPTVGTPAEITLGYSGTGVNAAVITDQHINIDCGGSAGGVSIPEQYGNVFDYAPNTKCYIWLPFIGFRELDVNDVMRGKVNVKYQIDVFTGECVAVIEVTRDTAGGALYSFAGNCAEHLPITGGSYMGLVMSGLGAAASVGVGLLSGGTLAPLAISGAAGALSGAGGGLSVQRSGNFSGNAGALGIKIPYLVFQRPQVVTAANFPTLTGYGANTYTSIGACSGFIRCREVWGSIPGATRQEREEIITMLKTGVIV